jgi:uncharacterized membrane protein
MDQQTSIRHTRIAGLLLGLGLGGFIDGIGLHQIAQWHNMLSARIRPDSMDAMMLNMRADGWFHAAVLGLTLVGLFLLYAASRRGEVFPPVRWFTGLLIGGWGLFNLVEGLINHHLLQLHHVRDLPVHVPAYDYAFLLIAGVGLILLGWLLARGQVR